MCTEAAAVSGAAAAAHLSLLAVPGKSTHEGETRLGSLSLLETPSRAVAAAAGRPPGGWLQNRSETPPAQC